MNNSSYVQATVINHHKYKLELLVSGLESQVSSPESAWLVWNDNSFLLKNLQIKTGIFDLTFKLRHFIVKTKEQFNLYPHAEPKMGCVSLQQTSVVGHRFLVQTLG